MFDTFWVTWWASGLQKSMLCRYENVLPSVPVLSGLTPEKSVSETKFRVVVVVYCLLSG